MSSRPFLIVALATVSLPCPAQLFQNPTAVRLTISTDKQSYKAGERVVASYRLQNVGKRKLFVPVRFSADCFPKTRWSTGLRDQNGKLTPNGTVGDCMPHSFPSLLEKLKANSKLLFPGEQYGPEETFDTKGLEPGLYRVTALLIAWKPTDFTEADQEELRQFGVPFRTGTLRASVTVRLTR